MPVIAITPDRSSLAQAEGHKKRVKFEEAVVRDVGGREGG
jgi:hypothetical protein